ncbi:MAG: hypothetical protein Q7R70_02455 [Candidatus Diapherotrites archaeon]|nr:hypothetical protein [Candidatus Diapherotrites archaeon]
MPLKRKAFVIAPSKEKADIERRLFEKFKADKGSGIPLGKLREIKGVKFSQKGIIIDEEAHPLLRQVRTISTLVRNPLEVARVAAERLALIKQLSQLGYRVAVPKYGIFKGSRFFEKAGKHARIFPARQPIREKKVIEGREISEVDNSALWARDLWTKVEGKRIMRFSKSGKNAFGEGGKLVQIAKKCFIANFDLREDPKVRELQKKGFRFFFTNRGQAFDRPLTNFLGRKTYILFEHPDLFVGSVGKVMLADHDFYRQNLGQIKDAARASGLKIVYVPEKDADLHPANFLQLEENKVLVDKDAVETISLLKANGVEVIPTTVSLRANRNAGGGLRCIVNEL